MSYLYLLDNLLDTNIISELIKNPHQEWYFQKFKMSEKTKFVQVLL